MKVSPKIYTPEYYALLHKMEERHWWCRGMRNIAEAFLKARVPAGARALDAGCGTGSFLEWLNQHEIKATGIDISEHALQICRQRDVAPLCRASVLQLPFMGETFDLITSNDVLQHVASGDEAILREFYRVLKTGGFLYLRTNTRQHFLVGEDPDQNYRRYSRSVVLEKAKAAGFQAVRSSFANSLPSVVTDFRNFLRSLKKQEQHIGYQGLIMDIPLPPVNAILQWFLKMEAWYLSSFNVSIPFGHSLVFLFRK